MSSVVVPPELFKNYNKLYVIGDLIKKFSEDPAIYFDENDKYLGIIQTKYVAGTPTFEFVGDNDTKTVYNNSFIYKKIKMDLIDNLKDYSTTDIFYTEKGAIIENKNPTVKPPEYAKYVLGYYPTTFLGGFYSFVNKLAQDNQSSVLSISEIVLERSIGTPPVANDPLLYKNNIYARFRISNGSYLPQDQAAITEFITNNEKTYIVDEDKIFTISDKLNYIPKP